MSQESFTSVDTKFKHPVPKTIYKNGVPSISKALCKMLY